MSVNKNNALAFFKLLGTEFVRNGCQRNAAALTYMSLFALVPIMTVTFSMFSVIPAFGGVGEKLQDLIFSNFVPESGAEIEQYLKSFSQQARSLTVVGVAILAVTAYLMLSNIEKSLNAIWGVKQARRGMSGFLLYWAVLSLGPMLLGAGLMVSTYVMSFQLLVGDGAVSVIAGPLFKIVPLLFSCGALTLLFVAVPNCRVPIKYAFIGGVITALLIESVKAGFAYFVSNSSFKLIYGAFAAVPLFLLWINILWTLVLGGAVLVKTLTEQSWALSTVKTPRLHLALRCLAVFDVKMSVGEEVSDQDCIDSGISWLAWKDMRSQFIDASLICITENGGFVLKRQLDKVTLWDMAEMLDIKVKDLSFSDDEGAGQVWDERLSVMEKEVYDHFSSRFDQPVKAYLPEAR